MEKGKVIPSNRTKESLLATLEKYNPNNPLEAMFDYVRIRFPTLDVTNIVENVLQLKMEYMVYLEYAFYSYDAHYYYGDIFVLVSHDEQKGVLVELKGKGCRQFENFLLAQKRTWYDFFLDCIIHKGVTKRLDIAINDKTGILSIPELTRKCENEECISVFRSFKSYRSGELTSSKGKLGMGNTLYIGSLKSEVYFCVYEKDYEQYIKYDIPIEDTSIKNRFEIRLKNERSHIALIDLITNLDIDKTAFEVINRYIRFVDSNDAISRDKWRTNSDWEYFIGKNRNKLKLTTEPEPYTLDKTLLWLQNQVAPTLKMIKTIDSVNNCDTVTKLIKDAKVSNKHRIIIKQATTDSKDIVAFKGDD